jgi:hypothetical protein
MVREQALLGFRAYERRLKMGRLSDMEQIPYRIILQVHFIDTIGPPIRLIGDSEIEHFDCPRSLQSRLPGELRAVFEVDYAKQQVIRRSYEPAGLLSFQ